MWCEKEPWLSYLLPVPGLLTVYQSSSSLFLTWGQCLIFPGGCPAEDVRGGCPRDEFPTEMSGRFSSANVGRNAQRKRDARAWLTHIQTHNQLLTDYTVSLAKKKSMRFLASQTWKRQSRRRKGILNGCAVSTSVTWRLIRGFHTCMHLLNRARVSWSAARFLCNSPASCCDSSP